MKKMILFFLMGLAAVLLAACQTASAKSDTVDLTIEMSEFAYSPDTIELKVGQEVTLRVVNVGALEHELMIGREVVTTDSGAPRMFREDFFEGREPVIMASENEAEHADTNSEQGNDHDEEGNDHDQEGESEHGNTHGFMVSVPGNSQQEVTLTFTVTEDMVGEWQMGCFVDGGSHYAAGMVGKVVVTP